MKPILTKFFAAMLAVHAAGCFTLESGTLARTGDENVLVTNYGWYLFGRFPIATGNANKDALAPFVFFRDDVKLDKIQKRLLDYSKTRPGKELRDITYHTRENVMFNLPGIEFQVPIPYVLTFREIQITGVLQ